MFVATKAKRRRPRVVVKVRRAEREANRAARQALSQEMTRDFVEIIDQWRDTLDISAVESHIAVNGAAGLVDGPLGYRELEAALGASLTDTLDDALMAGANIGARFAADQGVDLAADSITGLATRWMSSEGARRIAGISDTTRQAVVDVINARLRDQVSPQAAANEVGRLVGLDPRRAQAVQNFEADLIRRRIKSPELDTAFQREAIAQEVEAYRDRMMRDRGRAIAETEVQNAIQEGEREYWNQAVASGQVQDPELVQKRWFTVADDRVCAQCEPLHEVTVAFNELFDGSVQGPPLHPRCRCYLEIAPAGFGDDGTPLPHEPPGGGRPPTTFGENLATEAEPPEISYDEEQALFEGIGDFVEDDAIKITAKQKEALGDYHGYGAWKLNEALRQGKSPAQARTIRTVLGKNSLSRDAVVYRGVSSDAVGQALRELKHGDSLPIVGFQSTTISRRTAERYGSQLGMTGTEAPGEHILFEITARKGTPVVNMEQKAIRGSYASDGELLFPDSGHYKINGLTRRGRFLVVKAEHVYP